MVSSELAKSNLPMKMTMSTWIISTVIITNMSITVAMQKNGAKLQDRCIWAFVIYFCIVTKNSNCKNICREDRWARHDKTNKMSVHPARTEISLGIRSAWSESSLSALRKLGSLPIHYAHSDNSDQTGRMPRLIWVFAGCTVTLLILSCRGSYALTRRSY